MDMVRADNARAPRHSRWAALDVLHAPLEDLYALALPCTVRSLTVCGPFQRTASWLRTAPCARRPPAAWLRSVLQAAQPRALCLCGFDEDVLSAPFAEKMEGWHMAQLESFEIVLRLGCLEPHDTLDPASMLVRSSR